MASVTQRINQIRQPKGGYISPSIFDAIPYNDGISLNSEENISASTVGLTVDYLTRFMTGAKPVEAFKISLLGATIAEKLGLVGATNMAVNFLNTIRGLDDISVINACKLSTFDAWYRNPAWAAANSGYNKKSPDRKTIENIRTLVNRSISFFNKYGPVTKDGFTFELVNPDNTIYNRMLEIGIGTYGGYTPTVNVGDGDFLTADTLWDFKVSKYKPTTKHTLQLLMYWIMGQHSGQEIYKNIDKLGIFNPRLNTVYLLNMDKVSEDVIRDVEKDVICY